MQKYQNKYRIKSTRLQNWNYGWKGAYFITICTHNREHCFGEIINNNMVLSGIGKIAKSEWIKTFKIRVDMNLGMGEYVIMPIMFMELLSSVIMNIIHNMIHNVETRCIVSLPIIHIVSLPIINSDHNQKIWHQ